MKKDSNLNKTTYDVIVIGAGSGGLNIAGFMNKAGFKALLIDKSAETIGGDCLNFGCVPSKALLHAAKMVRESSEAEKIGLKCVGEVDMEKVMEYIKSKQDVIREHENAEYFRSRGMDVVLGTASFAGRRSVSVNGDVYKGKKIIIATGSRPREFKIPGLENVKHYYTNETIFGASQLPKRLLIVGAGPIGVEMAQAFSLLGREVTVIGPDFLSKEDPDIAEVARKRLEADGVKFLLGYKVTRIEDGEAVASNEEGTEKRVPFDALLMAVGREINTKALNPEVAGIKTDERGGVVVDKYLRTSNRDVLVCGDAVGGYMFTHAAELHASLIIKNFFKPIFKSKLNTDAMAWVTYTDPEVATFGLNKQQLDDRGIAHDVVEKTFVDDDRAIVDSRTEGKVKVYISKTGIILGGTMVARNAGELTQELMLAQANSLKTSAFMNKVYPYPTATRINRSMVLEYEGRKLTETAKKLLRRLF